MLPVVTKVRSQTLTGYVCRVILLVCPFYKAHESRYPRRKHIHLRVHEDISLRRDEFGLTFSKYEEYGYGSPDPSYLALKMKPTKNTTGPEMSFVP